MSGVDPARARGFDAWAGDYDRYRPTYPEELFEAIAQRLPIPRQPHVVDLGAGTGRASLAMAELGWRGIGRRRAMAWNSSSGYVGR